MAAPRTASTGEFSNMDNPQEKERVELLAHTPVFSIWAMPDGLQTEDLG